MLELELQRIIERINKIEDPNLNEGLGGGLFGKTGVFQNLKRNYNNGSQLQSASGKLKKTGGVIDSIAKELSNRKSEFDELQNLRGELNSLELDDETKKYYMSKLDSTITSYKAILKVANDFKSLATQQAHRNGTVGQDQSQQSAAPTPAPAASAPPAPAPQPTAPVAPSPAPAAPKPKKKPAPAPAPAATPAPKPAAPKKKPAKVFDINNPQFGAELDSFMNSKRMVSEGADLTYPENSQPNHVQDNQFETTYRALYQESNKMVKASGIENVNNGALGLYLRLALALIITKGEKKFMEEISSVKSGSKVYIQAREALYRVSKPSGDTQTAPGASNAGNQPQMKDRSHEAQTLAQEFLKQHGYAVTKANVQAVSTKIMQNHFKQ